MMIPRVLCLFLALAQGTQGTQDTCLTDGIPAEQRKNLVDPQTGESYPLGLWANGWAAALLMNEVARIILEEKLGFNVTDTGLGGATVDAFYALTGCSTPTTISDRGCEGATKTYTHASVEVWPEGYQPEWDALQDNYPDLAPINAGNIGYNGKVSYFFPKKVRDAAWEAEGLNLDFYRGYNRSWHDAAKYFDNPTVLDTELLLPCNETRLMISSVMKFYAEQSGDWDGVEVDGEEVRGKCFDGYFWYPPACRANPTTCFMWITGGNGWDMEGTMQKTAAYNIPMAAVTPKNYSLFEQLPLRVDSAFYWWIPDPTFLTLSPLELVFPAYDKQAYLAGDKRTDSTTTSVDIAISKDLQILAPNVMNFFQNWEIAMAEINKMLLDQINTGDTNYPVACRWVQSHEQIWSKWLPDTTKCFPQFGLWNTATQQFVADRTDRTFLECRACESGRFSNKLKDTDPETGKTGETYVCTPCAAGTAQPSGAALQCDPCLSGEYQDKPGQTGCLRCPISTYQHQRGQPQCIPCVNGTTTLGDGRPSVADCGCKEGSIDIGQGGNMSVCVSCSEGMTCPFSASERNLQNGTSSYGQDFVPVIVEGYFSTEEKPLEVFKCRNHIQCPGGKPQTCGGGLAGVPCAECPAGQTWSGSNCDECTAWSLIFWILSTLGLFGGLSVAYYLLTSQVTAKASVMATTGMSFGMTVNLLQSVGIVGMMTVEWPGHLTGLLGLFKVLLLDIDNYSFSCFAGANTALRYIVSVSFFFLGQAWLILNFYGSKLLPGNRAWGSAKTLSTMGQFWQVGFSTMSAVSMVPLTCLTHPSGQQSLLKYPNIMCGGDNGHGAMLVAGIALLVIGIFGFLSMCIYAAYMMPKWSAGDQRHLVQSFRFLVFRFRLDSWWYGVPLLVRGPLLSLPITLATDYPPVQTIMINVILSFFLIIETLSWPWKVPLLNLMDMWMTLCLMLLVTGSALYVDVSSGAMQSFASAFTTAVMGGIGLAMFVMFIVAVGALVHRTAMGGAQEYSFFNLGKVAEAKLVRERLQKISKELLRLDETWMTQRIGAMSAFDIRLITACITLLAIDLVPHKANELKFNFARVSAQSFAVRGKTQKNIYKDGARLTGMSVMDTDEAEAMGDEFEEDGGEELKDVKGKVEAEAETEPEAVEAEPQPLVETNAPNYKSGWC